jgi:hypothetical protein
MWEMWRCENVGNMKMWEIHAGPNGRIGNVEMWGIGGERGYSKLNFNAFGQG